mmetsp:Transcript_62072/g.183428  ORF Transcript_62072/g.183428 Transcript_62072/m.183428 type:complete len:259 (-) Transcript_62072:351-1127(-)
MRASRDSRSNASLRARSDEWVVTGGGGRSFCSCLVAALATTDAVKPFAARISFVPTPLPSTLRNRARIAAVEARNPPKPIRAPSFALFEGTTPPNHVIPPRAKESAALTKQNGHDACITPKRSPIRYDEKVAMTVVNAARARRLVTSISSSPSSSSSSTATKSPPFRPDPNSNGHTARANTDAYAAKPTALSGTFVPSPRLNAAYGPSSTLPHPPAGFEASLPQIADAATPSPQSLSYASQEVSAAPNVEREAISRRS